MQYFNQKGQALSFDANGYIQYGYDKNGYPEDMADDYDPMQRATTSLSSGAVSSGTGAGGGKTLDTIFGTINKAADVFIAVKQADTAKSNAQANVAAANYRINQGGASAQTQPGMKTGTIVLIVVVSLLVVGTAGYFIVKAGKKSE